MNYKTLLLDADGTLLDFHKSEQMALRDTFAHYHIPLGDEVLRRYEHINHDLWRRFEAGEIDKKTVLYSRFVMFFEELHIKEDGVRFEDAYQKALGEGAYLIEGAYEVMEELHRCCDLYIVTNGVSATQYSRLKKTGLYDLVRDVFVSEDIGYQKPQREYFDHVFSKIPSLEKKRTLMIGDSLSSDIRGGICAGIDTCWYHQGSTQKLADMPITYEIHDLHDLLPIVRGS